MPPSLALLVAVGALPTSQVRAAPFCTPTVSAADTLFARLGDQADSLNTWRVTLTAGTPKMSVGTTNILDPGSADSRSITPPENDSDPVGADATPTDVSITTLNRDVFRAIHALASLRSTLGPGVLSIGRLHCIAYRPHQLVVALTNTGPALPAQPLVLSVGSAKPNAAQPGATGTGTAGPDAVVSLPVFRGQTPPLPAGSTVPLLLDADRPYPTTGGVLHVRIAIGSH